jgi:hypothetical protein
MKKTQEVEPPSYLRPPLFMIGRDASGNWVVQDQIGARGGLFADRASALRFVRAENGYRPHAFVNITGEFELDIAPRPAAAPPQQAERLNGRARRVA